MFPSYHLMEKRTEEVIKFEFVKLWDWSAYSKRTWRGDISRGVLWRPHKNRFNLACIVTLTIQACFRRIYMKSSEHNGAYISSPICTNRLILSKWTFFILFLLAMPTNHIISQISILWRHHSTSLFRIVLPGYLLGLRGFLVIFLYLVWFSLCSSLF